MVPHKKQVPLPGGLIRRMNGVTFCFQLHKPDSMKRRSWELSVHLYNDLYQSTKLSNLNRKKSRLKNNSSIKGQILNDRDRRKKSLKRKHYSVLNSPINRKADRDQSVPVSQSSSGQHCHLCGTIKTGQWRRGPAGPRTLCNACGLDWSKKLKLEMSKRGPHVPMPDIENVVAEGWWKTSARRKPWKNSPDSQNTTVANLSDSAQGNQETKVFDEKNEHLDNTKQTEMDTHIRTPSRGKNTGKNNPDEFSEDASSPTYNKHIGSDEPSESSTPLAAQRPSIKILFPARASSNP